MESQFLLGESKENTALLLAQQRKKARKSFFCVSKRQFLATARLNGTLILGRNKNGVSVDTVLPQELGMIVDKWHVRLGFGREEVQDMAGKSSAQIEADSLSGSVPRKEAKVVTHIILAVRMLVHIRENYKLEIEETEKILSGLDRLNVLLSGKGPHNNDEIRTAIEALRSLDTATLEKKRSAVKKIVARARLEATADMLNGALGILPGNRAIQVAAACAVFTSLRDRLGKWRDRSIAKYSARNLFRENSLRVFRDLWVFQQLINYAKSPELISEYIKKDSKKLQVIEAIREKISGNRRMDDGARDEILKYMAENSALFRVEERERKDAGKMIALKESGFPPDKKKRYDYLMGNYEWLYRYVQSGDRQRAQEKLFALEMFVNANKPGYVLGELRKSNEPYLAQVVIQLGKAASALEEKDFGRAMLLFTNAAHRMSETFDKQ